MIVNNTGYECHRCDRSCQYQRRLQIKADPEAPDLFGPPRSYVESLENRRAETAGIVGRNEKSLLAAARQDCYQRNRASTLVIGARS